MIWDNYDSLKMFIDDDLEQVKTKTSLPESLIKKIKKYLNEKNNSS